MLLAGILGEIEVTILGGESPTATIRFTRDPVIEVRTSGTRIIWGTLTVSAMRMHSPAITATNPSINVPQLNRLLQYGGPH